MAHSKPPPRTQKMIRNRIYFAQGCLICEACGRDFQMFAPRNLDRHVCGLKHKRALKNVHKKEARLDQICRILAKARRERELERRRNRR